MNGTKHKLLSDSLRKMSSPRPSCLIVLSSAEQGVSANSFIQCYTMTQQQSGFAVQLAAPSAKAPDFVQQDDNCRRWLAEFRTKAFSIPVSLETIEATRYSALLIPNSPGAVHDLAKDKELAKIIGQFVKERKPICAIGSGVASLCCAKLEDAKTWCFKGYSMTAISVYEQAKTPEFATLPIILEDFIKDSSAKYSCSEPDAVHVIVDRHLITGQNEQSTLTAVQNLILMCNQRQGKTATR